MSKLLAAVAVIGVVGLGASIAPANATQANNNGISNGGTQLTVLTDDLSAARRQRRYVRRHYSYPYASPYPYGYYGPTYYSRPYQRPAPLWLGIGGHW